ncbi:HNH endonuclease [Lactiplantibacillus pentosus]|uniref:HNH endonuclease n=1 Tax=Lactiplantibacillus pentosus TaxID=1589 RepID=UPI00234A8521|nr:HNH endonuclease [Lactiplantibacillus pentosus]MDC6397293.1 HNH endonuclease [Lactiplantibacillus pentosus]
MSLLEKFSKVENVESPQKNLDVSSKFEKPSSSLEPSQEKRMDRVQETDNPEPWQSGTPLDGANGTWEGERGNSEWQPDPEAIPQNILFNPDQKTNAEIYADYPQDGVEFHNGEPDFSPFAKATVEIDNFSENRYLKGGNFDQATERFSEKQGLTIKEAKDYIKDNHLTWHERSDCKTMDLVPTEIHGNVRHSGGISKFKHQNGLEG